MPSEVEAISPTVQQLMQLIEISRCFIGHAFALELPLREALSNAVIHGNRMDTGKLVELHCRCDGRRGVWLVIKDQRNGFDPNAIPDPLQPEGLNSERRCGIYLMKLVTVEVSFKRAGTEVHVWKATGARA